MPNTAPLLTGFAPSVTFLENTVNATPQLLDADVTFTDPDNNFIGGTLTVSGLLAEDTISIRNQGMAAGEISLSSGIVSYGGIAIGTLTGGAGGALNITFNTAATSDAIDALLQNLTYANASDTPVASRTLTIDVRDAAGAVAINTPFFTERAGAANPANGLDAGDRAAPTLGDLDGDGDFDLVVGSQSNGLLQAINTGTNANPVFGALTQLGAGDDVIAQTLIAFFQHPTVFSDFAGPRFLVAGAGGRSLGATGADYDLDDGGAFFRFKYLDYYAPGFLYLQYAPDYDAAPVLGDLNDDDDPDLVLGGLDGALYLANMVRDDIYPLFSPATRIGTLDVGYNSTPTLGDLDGDGDLDLVVGERGGRLFQSINLGTKTNPVFGELTLISDIDVGDYSAPLLADLDGDGRLDLLVGAADGTLHTFINTSATQITIHVTAEAEPPVAQNDAFATGEAAAIAAGNLFADNGSGGDIDVTAVTAVNGVALVSGAQITLTSGALLIVNADGTFSYDPNGAFQYLGAAGSGAIAADLTATDSFTYTVTGGDTATVTFTVTGVDNNDTLHGQPSSDTLVPLHGGNGNDKLFAVVNQRSELHGDADNDMLYASGGNDALFGGAGIDWASYLGSTGAVVVSLVAPASNSGDAAGDSYDSIEAFSLSNNSDSFTGGTGNDIVWANQGADTLDGGAGNDQLNGGLGDDIMTGGANDDLYAVDSTGDVVTELAAGGYDRVNTSVSLTGTHALAAEVEYGRLIGAALNLDGNSGNNRLIGNALANRLAGANGFDLLTGGAGADTFVLQNLTAHRDRITDFDAADLLEISVGVFGGGLVAGMLGATQFEANTTGLANAAAIRFVFETDTNRLYFDTNGSASGGRQFIAILSNAPALTAADFILV